MMHIFDSNNTLQQFQDEIAGCGRLSCSLPLPRLFWSTVKEHNVMINKTEEISHQVWCY